MNDQTADVRRMSLGIWGLTIGIVVLLAVLGIAIMIFLSVVNTGKPRTVGTFRTRIEAEKHEPAVQYLKRATKKTIPRDYATRQDSKIANRCFLG